MNVEQRQVANNLLTKPTDLSRDRRIHLFAANVYTHHQHYGEWHNASTAHETVSHSLSLNPSSDGFIKCFCRIVVSRQRFIPQHTNIHTMPTN